MAGVLQAQHNTMLALGELPTALNLRRVIHSQALMSYEAARRSTTPAPELVERFAERADTYQVLLRQTRELGGLIGRGAVAAAEAANAVSRMQKISTTPVLASDDLHELNRVLARTDARLASTLERGFAERIYYLGQPTRLVYGESATQARLDQREWVPVTAFFQPDLIDLIRGRLRPPPAQDKDPHHQQSRTDYTVALNHRPLRTDRHSSPRPSPG